MKKINKHKQQIAITVQQDFSLEDLATMICNSVDTDLIPTLIAMIDLEAQDWDITIKLINHYEALKREYIKDVHEGEESLKDLFKSKKIK